MQTVLLQTTRCFIDDAAAVTTGLGRGIRYLATSRIEQLARACDVADVLAKREAKDISNWLRDPLKITSSLRVLNDLS